jgi:hypothetical protein
MKYTKKQRKKIYLEALERLSAADLTADPWTLEGYARYVCHAVAQSCDVDHNDVAAEFPEAYAFANPDHRGTVWLCDHDSYPNTEAGHKLRQTVLIFAAELCDDREFSR